MKKRDIFLPSLTTLLIFSMAMFLSCAHQNRADEDGLNAEAEAGQEQADAAVTEEGSAVAEAPPTENGEQQQAQLSELSQTTGDQAAPPAEGTPPADGQKAAENADLAALGLGDTQAPADAAATTTPPPADGAAAKPELDPLGLEGTTAAAGTTAPGDVAPTTPPTEPPAATTDTLANNTPPPAEPPPMMAPIVEKPSHKEASFSGHSRVPKIPGKALKRGGVSLNRFYFVRQGDTPQTVSQLIYGNEDQAKNLKKWNGKGWAAGNLIYYSSPVDASENKMRSFYQEKNVQPEEYSVQRGDWLSKVAKQHLGAAGSWKEVAVINGMKSPDQLEVGQKIAIYPKDLSGYSGQPQQQAAERVEEPPKQVAVAPTQPVQPQQPVQQAQPQEPSLDQTAPVVPDQQPVSPPKKVSKSPSLDGAKLLEQNLPAVMILGLVVVLSGLYMVVRKKKTSRALDEFGDDNFAAPTKLKRK